MAIGNYDIINIKHYCISGLPIACISESEILKIMHDCCEKNHKIIVNTPNLNFLRTSYFNNDFNKSLINSDILIPDGMPLIWISKILGLSIKERLAGSNLITNVALKLNNYAFKVFYFGGGKNVSKRAHRLTNAIRSKTISVGYLDPGFGDVTALSKKEYLDKINNSKTNILLVSLSAKKGTLWIDKNKNTLNSNISISSGATTNFIAGKTKRAPSFIQNIGLEWLWRLNVEPRLFSRYVLDGLWFLAYLITKILPLFLLTNIIKLSTKKYSNQQITENYDKDFTIIKLPAYCEEILAEDIKSKITKSKTTCVKLDTSNIVLLDNRIIGEIIFLKSHLQKFDKKISVINPSIFCKILIFLNNANKALQDE